MCLHNAFSYIQFSLLHIILHLEWVAYRQCIVGILFIQSYCVLAGVDRLGLAFFLICLKVSSTSLVLLFVLFFSSLSPPFLLGYLNILKLMFIFYETYLFIYLFYTWVFCMHVYLCMHQVHYCWPWSSEKDMRPPGTGVMDDHKPPCGCWESKLGPLQEQQELYTTEPFL